MATTYKELISKVTNLLKLNNKDDAISRRFILKLFKDSATSLISQKLLDRTITNETNLYIQIECFDFELVETKVCDNIEFRLCKVLMRSKKPLPKLIFSRLGASIKEITTIDGNYNFIFVDKGQYKRNKNRKYNLKDEVYIYLGTDNHLYIPDREIRTVDLTVLTSNPEDAAKCSSCAENSNLSIWDTVFNCPDKLQDVVFQQVIQQLGINRQIRDDQNPNNLQGA